MPGGGRAEADSELPEAGPRSMGGKRAGEGGSVRREAPRGLHSADIRSAGQGLTAAPVGHCEATDC